MKVKAFIKADCDAQMRCAVFPNCGSCLENMLSNCDGDRLMNIEVDTLTPHDIVVIERGKPKPVIPCLDREE